MSIVKIETLTPVHIGSGETLQHGNDFVKRKDDDGDNILGIIDPRKVMQLIGEENIDKWVAAIEKKESTDKIVKIYAPKAKVEDYSKRIILDLATAKDTDTLKEHIHAGDGSPYIPGSSIKGAIRTAVLASLASGVENLENKIRDRGGRISAKTIESELLGENPNKDVFRFLQVGDAYFRDKYEISVRMVNINERTSASFWDTSKAQLIEAIDREDKATFQIKLNNAHYALAENKVHRLPDCMKSLSSLFETINKHTQSLIEEEIEYWQERVDKDKGSSVEKYIAAMKDVLEEANACEVGKSCVLRIGHGSGWRFITGAWTERIVNFNSGVVPAARPNNGRYAAYDFPKTRRVSDMQEELLEYLLGFVRLELIK